MGKMIDSDVLLAICNDSADPRQKVERIAALCVADAPAPPAPPAPAPPAPPVEDEPDLET